MNLHHPKWLLLGLALAATTSVAGSAHFVRGPDASIDTQTGNVTVTWKEAGLGDTVTVHYVAVAVAGARFQCVNKGGNCPAASNKQDVIANVSASGDFNSGKNGAINGSLTFEPPAGTLRCPGGQVLKRVSVAFSGIALTDDTFHVTAAALPSALSMSGPECP